jgi:tetratricopeptide (TPR) repeat protein
MADTDDAPPSSSSPAGDLAPAPTVISLAERRRRGPTRSAAEQIRRRLIALVDPEPAAIANEIQIDPEPPSSEPCADVERRELDRDIAQEERKVARGDSTPARLRNLRSLRAMDNIKRGARGAAYQEWQALFEESPHDPDPLLTRGLFFSCEGDFDTALDDYDHAAAIRPDDPEVYERRGSCFVRRGDWGRALVDYQRLVHLRPRDRDALCSLATSLRFTDDIDGAIRVLGRAIKIFPWRAELYSGWAGYYHLKGSRAEELVDLDHSIARDPQNAEALRARASVHSHFQDDDRSRADLTRAIALDPSHAEAFFARAQCHAKRGPVEPAIADFSRAIELEPDRVRFLDARAEAYMKTGAFDLAVGDLSRVIDLESRSDASTLWQRGHAHRRRGDSKSAVADYDEAMCLDGSLFDELVRSERRRHTSKQSKAEPHDDLDTLILLAPEHADYLARRAAIFTAAGEHEKALVDYNQAIALEADRNDFLHARAMTHLSLGERAKAIEDESRAMELAPFAARHHGWRGTMRLYEEGPSPEAEADVERAVELAPDDPTMLYLLAGYLAEVGRHEEAVRVHDRRVALHPTYGFLYAGRGEARLQLPHDEANLRAALADFDHAIELDQEEAEVLRQRAEVHALLGEEDAARGDRERAIALDANPPAEAVD